MKIEFKKLDWETPFGEVVVGKVYKGELISFTENQINYAKKEGFNHLIDGTFFAFKDSKDHRTKNVSLVTLEYIKNKSGQPIKLVYTGKGNTFIIEEGEC